MNASNMYYDDRGVIVFRSIQRKMIMYLRIRLAQLVKIKKKLFEVRNFLLNKEDHREIWTFRHVSVGYYLFLCYLRSIAVFTAVCPAVPWPSLVLMSSSFFTLDSILYRSTPFPNVIIILLIFFHSFSFLFLAFILVFISLSRHSDSTPSSRWSPQAIVWLPRFN